jgi:hypothetical protein
MFLAALSARPLEEYGRRAHETFYKFTTECLGEYYPFQVALRGWSVTEVAAPLHTT